MSQTGHHKEHGTTKAYIIGFVLSLIFTIIPYYLVTHKSATNNLLLGVILVFGVIQMIIQITFFLHIGRGPKPNWQFWFFVSTVGIILVVVGGSIVIISNLHYNMRPSDEVTKLVNDEGIYQINGQLTGACQGTNANHQVVITNGQASPVNTTAKKCDTLTFMSGDNVTKQIYFGNYPERDAYAGATSLLVRKGQNQTITLSETGAYRFYDLLHTETTGEFQVSQ